LSRFARQLARLPRRALADSSAPNSNAIPAASGRMEALRRRLSRALGSHVVLPAAGPPSERLAGRFDEVLPFSVVDTPAGPLYRRQDTACVRVGGVALAGATLADNHALSLLALTPALAGVDVRDALFVDTETTGLGGGTGNYAFLVGLCFHDGDCWRLEQVMLRDPDDERAMLIYVRERIAAAGAIVSYNGKSFDLPLLRARCTMQKLDAPPDRPHLDLLHVARRVHKAQTFRKNLVTLEQEVLGFRRGPDVHGEEVAARYLQYLRSGDAFPLEPVVTHNAWDVLSLVALIAVYGHPIAQLNATDLASVARVMKRAGDLDLAHQFAEIAMARGARNEGLRVRAFIHKARGDREQALADFETLSQNVSDPDVRLELAKLYEHYKRAPGRALQQVERGTGEDQDAMAHRRRRLNRKLEKLLQKRASCTRIHPSHPQAGWSKVVAP
jgi:uncharacterized protein YprB with RNaseH-like and TPR domain